MYTYESLLWCVVPMLRYQLDAQVHLDMKFLNYNYNHEHKTNVFSFMRT